MKKKWQVTLIIEDAGKLSRPLTKGEIPAWIKTMSLPEGVKIKSVKVEKAKEESK